jgi:pyocin large subunit-like protein
MAFSLVWDEQAAKKYKELERIAKKSVENRKKAKKTKASKEEGLFKQVRKCITLLKNDPRHPSLETHECKSLANPHNPKGKVFEAYAQHKTPGAYRVFWCYGPHKDQITIIAITPHP